jgi:hypothetical protein
MYYYRIKILEKFDDTIVEQKDEQKDEIVKLQTRLNPDKCLGVDSDNNITNSLGIIDCRNDGSKWTYTPTLSLRNNLKNRYLISNQDQILLSTEEIKPEEELSVSKNNDKEILIGTNYLCADQTIGNKCSNNLIEKRGTLIMINDG